MEELREETEEIEVKVETGEARAFYSDKGAEAFKKHLAKKRVCGRERLQRAYGALQECCRE